MQYFPFLVLYPYFMKYMGSMSLKMDSSLSTDKKGVVWIILWVDDSKNWLFLLHNVLRRMFKNKF